MANLTLDFFDTFLAYTTPLAGRYTHQPTLVISTEASAGPFLGERVATPGTSMYKAVTATETLGMGQKMAPLSGNSWSLAQMRNSVLGGLEWRVLLDGSVALISSHLGTLNTSPAGIVPIGTAYIVVETFARFVASGSIETRINGTRIPSLTTTDWVLDAGTGQPAGTLAPMNLSTIPGGLPTIPDFGGFKRIGWLYQKRGSGLWKSIPTGVTVIGDLSDFIGDAKRGWNPVNAAGAAYPFGAGSNWKDSTTLDGGGSPIGAGTYPTCVADSPAGVDSDTSFLGNITTPTAATADKISHDYTNLPANATKVLAAQRSLVLKGSATGSPTRCRTYLRNAGVDVVDTGDIDIVNGQYLCTTRAYGQMPYTIAGTTIWSPTTYNAIEGVLEALSLTP